MDNNTKIGAGVSVAGVVLLIYHFIHVVHVASEIGEKDKNEPFKNAPVYFIQSDCAGKKDTMMMEHYLKKVK